MTVRRWSYKFLQMPLKAEITVLVIIVRTILKETNPDIHDIPSSE